jgi:hypothetical protein
MREALNLLGFGPSRPAWGPDGQRVGDHQLTQSAVDVLLGDVL